MNTRLTMQAAFAIGVASAIGCGTTPSSNTGADAGPSIQPTFTSINANIFQPSCANSSCHSPTGEAISGKLDLSTSPYAALLGANGKGAPIPDSTDPGEIKAASEGYLLVTPGNPAKSFLYLKISPNLDPSYGAQMPNLGTGLTAEQVQAVSDWITAGALNN